MVTAICSFVNQQNRWLRPFSDWVLYFDTRCIPFIAIIFVYLH